MVGHPESDVARMLRPFPQVVIVPTGDVPAARRALVRLWDNERSPDPSLLQSYTSRHVSRLLARLLDSVCP
jgi:hypothetical protein